VISRYFVIALAIGVGVMQAINHAWIEAAGLFGLGIGLILLRLVQTGANPALKKVAWALFVVTIVAMSIVFKRDFLR
jgi:hypothetical protein